MGNYDLTYCTASFIRSVPVFRSCRVMARRGNICTRTTMYVTGYLLVIGVLEYVIILELHSRLHLRESAKQDEQTLVLTQAELDSLKSWRERREMAGPKDRARAVEWRVSNFVPAARRRPILQDEPRLGDAPERHGKTLQQYLGADGAPREDGGGAILQGGETENLANWPTDEKNEDYEEDEDEEDEDEENEEKKDNWVFDPDDFEIIVSKDGTVEVRRKPEVLVENMTLPARNLTPFEQDGGNIMLTLRFVSRVL